MMRVLIYIPDNSAPRSLWSGLLSSFIILSIVIDPPKLSFHFAYISLISSDVENIFILSVFLFLMIFLSLLKELPC